MSFSLVEMAGFAPASGSEMRIRSTSIVISVIRTSCLEMTRNMGPRRSYLPASSAETPLGSVLQYDTVIQLVDITGTMGSQQLSEDHRRHWCKRVSECIFCLRKYIGMYLGCPFFYEGQTPSACSYCQRQPSNLFIPREISETFRDDSENECCCGSRISLAIPG